MSALAAGGIRPPEASTISEAIDDATPVFTAANGLVDRVPVPRFGERERWSGACLRRPSNVTPGNWRIVFPTFGPVWNARAREVAFGLLNPTHPVLRASGVFRSAQPARLSTVRQLVQRLSVLGRWAQSESLPDLPHWDQEMLAAFVAFRLRTGIHRERSLIPYQSMFMALYDLHPVLTAGGLVIDPSLAITAKSVAAAQTATIDPTVWWPLLRAAWAYVDRFADDILTAREETSPAGPSRRNVRQRPPARTRSRPAAELDALLHAWLADPGNRVPVQPATRITAQGEETVRTPCWSLLASTVHGPGSGGTLSTTSAASRRRRDWVQAAVEGGQYYVLTRRAGATNLPHPTPHFTTVRRADGTTGPWRSHMSERDLGEELRALQGAAYCFVAALSMMRDSEIQEIRRGALTDHHGSPALRSHKLKNEPEPVEEKWWIIQPVATALTVLERLSRHPTHLFTTTQGSTERDTGAVRCGITASYVIDSFIAHVNAHHHTTGLDPIPERRVRPHQFRKTMSVICGQEPDGEIALGIQLKHAARRILANPTTHSYAAPNGAWMREFDDRLATAAAAKLTGLLAARTTGATVAVGPAATRLHAGLDRVAAQLEPAITQDDPPTLQALGADAHTAAALLRSELLALRFGTLNHCLWQPEWAECTQHLPEGERQQPLIGACQPTRCRNSAVTADHAPIWLAEQSDLTQQLRDRRLPPARRAALQARLDDVETITTALTQDL
ncbi:hypothetical protein [Streptomyces ardesiacus]|uniref:hypothetical protein n=1 Tax=Streptomyces ardesiacus TaxID=285564 RepID=UPI00201FA96A|nr:hypothetical protein [Streptomyces ardesiacus]MCL7369590.1 hypothetical protein [Streptomyces ardesiacus]